MLVVIEMEIPLGLLVLLAEHAVGGSELGHNEPASIQVADEAPENGVGNARHRSENRCGSDLDITDAEADRDRLQRRCQADSSVRPTRAVPRRVVPAFAHRSILLGLSSESPRLTARAQFHVYQR